MEILPLSPAPFTAPTDRDMLPSERREFVRTHRTCIFGYARRSDGPCQGGTRQGLACFSRSADE